MAITLLKANKRRIIAGQSGYYQIDGLAKFTTTDLTGTIPCELLSMQSGELTPIGAGDALHFNETVDEAAGVIKPQYGVLNIRRTASTSGLIFSFSVRGIY